MQKCQNTITAKEIMQPGNDLPSSHFQNLSSNQMPLVRIQGSIADTVFEKTSLSYLYATLRAPDT